jgi:carbon monoxide dehydrogenase subunit G
MDKLLNEFTVNRPIDEAWAVLTDVERIAPCMPGAQLEEIEGDVFRGVVKVKLGAISTAFKGQASFTERDDADHRAVLKAEGRDTGGKGNADALITARLESVSSAVTKCVVETDLRVTGKVAQFGRGIMADVSKKLMTQFSTNLNKMLDGQGAGNDGAASPAAPAESKPTEPQSLEPANDPVLVTAGGERTVPAATGTVLDVESPPAEPASPDPKTADPKTSGSTAAEPAGADHETAESPAPAGAQTTESTTAVAPPRTATVAAPTVRKIEGPAAEPIDLSSAAGGAILKRLLPVFGGIALVLLLLRRLRK